MTLATMCSTCGRFTVIHPGDECPDCRAQAHQTPCQPFGQPYDMRRCDPTACTVSRLPSCDARRAEARGQPRRRGGRVCRVCGLEKPLTAFGHWGGRNNATAHSKRCLDCDARALEASRQRIQARHQERQNERRREKRRVA